MDDQVVADLRTARSRLATRAAEYVVSYERARGRYPNERWIRSNIDQMLELLELGIEAGLYDNEEVIQEQKAYGLEYQDAARRDLKLVRLLRVEQEWADMIYHLQQAVEKSSSALVIGIGALEPDDDVIHHHNIADRILTLFSSDGGQRLLKLTKAITGKDYGDSISKVNALTRESKEAIRAWGNAEIGSILHMIDAAQAGISKARLPSRHASHIKKMVAEELPQYSAVANSTKVTTDPMRVCLLAYLLGIMLSPHENSTRYPGHGLAPSDYRKRLPIVRHSEQIEAAAGRLFRATNKTLRSR